MVAHISTSADVSTRLGNLEFHAIDIDVQKVMSWDHGDVQAHQPSMPAGAYHLGSILKNVVLLDILHFLMLSWKFA